MTVAIIDYGAGNMHNMNRALRHLGAAPHMITTAAEISAADRLVLPGVGAFGPAMAELETRGLAEAIHRHVAAERPFLGVCLGMQLMLEGSDEFGSTAGLGLVPGWVVRLSDVSTGGAPIKVPQIGWNDLQPGPDGWGGSILAGMEAGDAVYFVHSFAAVPARDEDWLAHCTYGGHRICAALRHGANTGCQFHPEKSGNVGLRVLESFLSS